MAYEAWEWGVLAASIFITLAYHIVFRQSRLGAYQSEVLPVWAFIHEQTCKQSILMIQLMRNMMNIATSLSAVMLGLLMMVVRMNTPERKVELAVVSCLCAAGFVMYVFSASNIATLTFNMALYPTDLSSGVDPAVVDENRVRTRHQLKMLARHYGFAKRLTFVTIQTLFLLIHPVAFLIVTCLSVYMWYYVDTQFGVKLGGINLSLLSWGVTPSALAQMSSRAGDTHGSMASATHLDAIGSLRDVVTSPPQPGGAVRERDGL